MFELTDNEEEIKDKQLLFGLSQEEVERFLENIRNIIDTMQKNTLVGKDMFELSDNEEQDVSQYNGMQIHDILMQLAENLKSGMDSACYNAPYIPLTVNYDDNTTVTYTFTMNLD